MTDLDKLKVFPGDQIIDSFNNTTVRLAAGVTFQPLSNNYGVQRAGYLRRMGYSGASDTKPILWVETSSKRYEPQVDDYIIATITERNFEQYKLDIGHGRIGNLGVTSFDGATRNNCPKLEIGQLVYCRVAVVNKYLDPELTCCALVNKRDWVTGEAMFGPLKDGMLVHLSIKFVHQLMADDCEILNLLGSKIRFEIAIGMNGQVWVDSETVRHTIILINTLSKVDTDPNADAERLIDTALRALTQ